MAGFVGSGGDAEFGWWVGPWDSAKPVRRSRLVGAGERALCSLVGELISVGRETRSMSPWLRSRRRS